MPSRSPRTLPFLIAALVTACTFAGCAPAPAPAPSATPAFASEKEAFAAAEDTYRAYIDALNAVDLTNPDTFEPVFDLLTDSAASATRKSFSEFHAEGVVMSGSTLFDSFEGLAYEPDIARVTGDLCLDVTGIQLTDAAGRSLVSPDRLDRQSMRVVWRTVSTSGELEISSMQATEGDRCAR